jgi:hypothetical protein
MVTGMVMMHTMKLVVVNEVNIQNCQIQKATQSAVRFKFRAEDKSIGEHVTVISEQKYHPGTAHSHRTWCKSEGDQLGKQ